MLHTRSGRTAGVHSELLTRDLKNTKHSVIGTCIGAPCNSLNANPAKLYTRREQQNPQKLRARPGLNDLALQSIINYRNPAMGR